MITRELTRRLRSMGVTQDDIHDAADTIERLQKIIDSRPAINDGIVDTYTNWSQAIYAGKIQQAMEASGINIVRH